MAQLNSENLTKSAENHRLRRNIKKVTQELSTLQQERERLEKDLEEAHRESGRGDHTIRVSSSGVVGLGLLTAVSDFRDIFSSEDLEQSEKSKGELISLIFS